MSSDCPAEPDAATLEAVAQGIDALVQRDPGGRGLAWWAEGSDLLESARSLMAGRKIAITTGFYIRSRGVIETDGPPGAIVLAEALLRMGKEVLLLVDEHALPVIRAGLDGAGPVAGGIPVVGLPPGDSPRLRQVGADSLSHIVAIERPGRSRTGAYVSMRGEDITPYVAALDVLFTDPDRTYTTLAIGDGGNELGFLRVAERVDRYTGDGAKISCRTPADLALFAGVSNWGAYGLCAMLSLLTGVSLLPDAAHVRKILKAMVASGAVDGVTLEQTDTVDGLSIAEDRTLLSRLSVTLRKRLQGRAPSVPRTGPLGDTALLWSWPGGIGTDTSRAVLDAYRLLRRDRALEEAGMVDVVPSYCALALYFDPARADRDRLVDRAETLLSRPGGADAPAAGESAPPASIHPLPVLYDGEDLPRVADRAGLSVREVIDLHRRGEYTVAMIGFRPHFPYLIGMDPRLATPRMDSPRTRIPAGSVGIAGEQTGVYPIESPGGWNIIGRTNPELLVPIKPGDGIVFLEVTECNPE